MIFSIELRIVDFRRAPTTTNVLNEPRLTHKLGRPDALNESPRVIPDAWRSPSMMPGGLYRIENGFTETNSEPNLRFCPDNM
jgi:hypothetical protein